MSKRLFQPILSAPIGITIDRKNNKLYYTEVIISPQSGHIWESGLDRSNAKKITTTPLSLGLYYTEDVEKEDNTFAAVWPNNSG